MNPVLISVVSLAVALASAAAIAVVHLAGIGRLSRQRIVGIRVPKLLASDEAWRKGHRAATPIVWLIGSISVLASLGALAAAAAGASSSALALLGFAAVALAVGLLLAAFRAVNSV